MAEQQVVVGIEVRSDTEDAKQLFTCAVRRLIRDDEAEPDTRVGTTPIRVFAEPGTDVQALADEHLASCASELKSSGGGSWCR